MAKLSISDRCRIRNREIGFIFQAFNLIGDLTVYENVELPLTYRSTGLLERKKRVQQALERVGMSHRTRHYPAQLSGGQQQRVAVARALVGRPAITLADDPTGNLDSKNGEAVMDLLRELHSGGATICMVTHDERYAHHAARTVHLFDGRIVEETMRIRLNLRNGNVLEKQRSVLCDQIWKMLSDAPGVASVSQSALTPIMGMGMPSSMLSPTPGAPTGESPDLSFGAANLIFINFVSPNYFATLRTPLLSGRDFTEADIAQAQAVSIISETMAHEFFPGVDPIGRYFTTEQFPRQAHNKFLVIGVVNDMKYMDIREDFHAVAYFPITQLSLLPDLTNFEIRTKLSQASIEKAVVDAVASVDSNIPLQFSTFQEQVSNAMIQDRILAMLTAFFGVLALLLVLIGLYGVVSYVVARRTPEIGIRMALGATRRNVLRLVMGQSIVTILIGTGTGVLGSILATRYLSSLLYGITPTDPLTLASVLVLLIAVASLAIYIPARRATHIDPIQALRQE